MTQTSVDWPKWSRRVGQLLLVVFPILLLWWTFREVPFAQVWAALRQLEIYQIGIWLSFNLGLAFLMVGRWWLILRTLGYRIPYLALTRYRFASFGVSYFTPGPQFGGEPVQVLALQKRHQVPGTTGTASVSLDKLLEMIANFSFLVIGISVALAGAWLPIEWRGAGISLSLGMLVFPLFYLIQMLRGRQPLTDLLNRIPEKLSQNWFAQNLRIVECEMSEFCTTYPGTVIAATFISVSVWTGMVAEYWLLTRFLGLRLSISESISAMVAARLAILTPLPGGLGALEASQMLAMRALGQPESLGVGLAILIRSRDILFGVVGLVGVASLLAGHPLKLIPPTDRQKTAQDDKR